MLGAGGGKCVVSLLRHSADRWVCLFPGLGHFGVQYAKAMGMRIIAVDGGDEKERLCKDLGAEAYIDYTKIQDIPAEVMRITTYGAHGIIVFAATRQAYQVAPSLARPGGTVVAVGLPPQADVFCGAPPIAIVMKRLNIVGSVTGTLKVSSFSCGCDQLGVNVANIAFGRMLRKRLISVLEIWFIQS